MEIYQSLPTCANPDISRVKARRIRLGYDGGGGINVPFAFIIAKLEKELGDPRGILGGLGKKGEVSPSKKIAKETSSGVEFWLPPREKEVTLVPCLLELSMKTIFCLSFKDLLFLCMEGALLYIY